MYKLAPELATRTLVFCAYGRCRLLRPRHPRLSRLGYRPHHVFTLSLYHCALSDRLDPHCGQRRPVFADHSAALGKRRYERLQPASATSHEGVTSSSETSHVTLRYVTLRYVTLRYVTLRYVTLRHYDARVTGSDGLLPFVSHCSLLSLF